MDKKNPHGHHDPEKEGCNDHTSPDEYHEPQKDYGDCYPSPNGYLGPVVDPCDLHSPPASHYCEPVGDPCYQGPVITPAHGWLSSPVSRTGFAVSRGWLPNGWPASEMEGMKNFPLFTNGNSSANLVWFPGEGGPFPDSIHIFPGVASPVPDGRIFSGGQTANNRDIVNLTDDELEMRHGVRWPRTNVESGQYLPISWNHTVVHATRGYRYFITRNGWDPTRRATRADFEDAPFASVINRTPPLNTLPTQTIKLPTNKTGHHIILSVWMVANTGAGFILPSTLTSVAVAVAVVAAVVVAVVADGKSGAVVSE
ncbi:lytic polysaccharide monooxygenase auxiliary activity family 9 protein [Symbiopectobacterium purcellii]|uniref:Lytic polysaccharide monooxygenase n=1 Tax=Symbiopectobacterium purcellii TaxID=2871826 RepID=A0ABX9ARS5_9ENTR|nr:lytic polysaccharide monooxygenase auxiliary activity family 9 protein [Symbiopectobacterium purcellii]QZN95690.1 lytic polysaccharide monooxygenase [Symbiopectobacterium purcellii]